MKSNLPGRNVFLSKDLESFPEFCAEKLFEFLQERAARQEKSYLAISGGNTPRPIYEELQRKVESLNGNFVESTFWFQTDERNVPWENPENNGKMIQACLFSKGETSGKFHRLRVEVENPARTAQIYQRLLADLVPRHNGVPQFDLILLGIGNDGHIASLFPESNWKETTGNFQAFWIEKLTSWRFSLTFPVLAAAKRVVFIASGEGKQKIISDVFHGKALSLPSGKLFGERATEWWLDPEAGKLASNADIR